MYRKSKHTYYIQWLFFVLENHAVYEIMWKNTVERGRPQMTIWRVGIAYWIPQATNTQSQYVIFNASLLQKWLHERAWMFRLTCIVRLVFLILAWNFEQKFCCVRLGFMMAVNITVCWCVTPCGLVDRNQLFGGTLPPYSGYNVEWSLV
jgi:hypothetical protein